MNALRLFRRMFSRTLVGELLIMLLIFFIYVTLCLALEPFADLADYERNLSRTIALERDRTLFFNPPSQYLQPDFTNTRDVEPLWTSVRESMARCGIEAEELRSGERMVCMDKKIDDGTDSQVAHLLYYNRALYSRIQYTLFDGSGDLTREDDAPVPVLIGGALAREYAVGDTFSLSESVSERNERNIRCVVRGVLRADSVVISLSGHGTVPSIYIFGSMLGDDANMILTLADYLPQMQLSAAGLFLQAEPVSAAELDALNASIDGEGGFSDCNGLSASSWNAAFKRSTWSILILLCLLITILFSYGGQQFLRYQQKKRCFYVLRICGMSEGRLARMEFLSGFLMLLLPIAAGVWALPDIASWLKTRADTLRVPLAGALTALLTLILLLCLWAMRMSERGKSAVSLYRAEC